MGQVYGKAALMNIWLDYELAEDHPTLLLLQFLSENTSVEALKIDCPEFCDPGTNICRDP
jgi:hypothetical protein